MLKYEPVCSWIGNGEGCTNPSVPNKSYCEEHVWIVYNKGTGLGRRKRDITRANAVFNVVSDIDAAAAELNADGEL